MNINLILLMQIYLVIISIIIILYYNIQHSFFKYYYSTPNHKPIYKSLLIFFNLKVKWKTYNKNFYLNYYLKKLTINKFHRSRDCPARWRLPSLGHPPSPLLVRTVMARFGRFRALFFKGCTRFVRP